MPQPDLLEGHRTLMRTCRHALPVRLLRRHLRAYLRRLHDAGYVALDFDWSTLETMVTITTEGEARLKRDREAHLTRL
jgi:hypothetical protein